MPKCKLRLEMLTMSLLLLGTMPAGAQSSVWNGSYAADGVCFCSGNQGPEIDSQIMPTPIGGQSVKQICERIGDGPTLLQTNDKFNYSVYPDPQCGHGPHLDGAVVSESTELGPKWDLNSVYSTSSQAEALTPGVSDTPIVTSGPRYIVPNKSSTEQSTAAMSEPVKSTSSTISSTAEKAPEKAVKVAEPETVAKTSSGEANDSAPALKREKPTNESLMARMADKIELARERARLEELEKQKLARELAEKKQAEDQQQAIIAKSNKPETDTAANETAETPAVGVEQVKSELKEQVANTGSEDAKREEMEAALGVVKESESADAPILAALKLPNQVRSSSREFNFVQAQPVNFDFGGAGLSVAASASSHNRIQYFLDAAMADTYREVRGGVGYYITPAKADRLTFLFNLGLEAGQFEFSGPGLTTSHSDSGAYIGASSRLVVNNKFELQAGVGYSSFFEGDAKAFGAALFHLNKDIDLTGNVKLGDNDSVGFGVRFYY